MANTYRDMAEAKKVLKNEPPVDTGRPKTIKGEPAPEGGWPKDSPGSKDHPKPGVGRDETVYKQQPTEQITGGHPHGDGDIDEDRSKKPPR